MDVEWPTVQRALLVAIFVPVAGLFLVAGIRNGEIQRGITVAAFVLLLGLLRWAQTK